jgi:ATP-dependent protease ClpP protease subunit
MERDHFFDADEAADYGLIDRVIESHELQRVPIGFRDGDDAR